MWQLLRVRSLWHTEVSHALPSHRGEEVIKACGRSLSGRRCRDGDPQCERSPAILRRASLSVISGSRRIGVIDHTLLCGLSLASRRGCVAASRGCISTTGRCRRSTTVTALFGTAAAHRRKQRQEQKQAGELLHGHSLTDSLSHCSGSRSSTADDVPISTY